MRLCCDLLLAPPPPLRSGSQPSIRRIWTVVIGHAFDLLHRPPPLAIPLPPTYPGFQTTATGFQTTAIGEQRRLNKTITGTKPAHGEDLRVGTLNSLLALSDDLLEEFDRMYGGLICRFHRCSASLPKITPPSTSASVDLYLSTSASVDLVVTPSNSLPPIPINHCLSG
ncbi:hypothetical protein L2E82_36133 [Cichorium intybus]|uniref:Uncharacterized protein n=1 Tax=Cichorium intybus TaxID=13427 RepID=A0ACB9BQR2_CICIN|nr:hypothetical protein L2E82_36133 [Cichorium intybus]